MIRKIIHIEEEKCNGCGLCAKACHEEAIAIIDGKAKLLRDDYCDGLGDCLPTCPAGAIYFVEREAAAYDEAAVLQNKKEKMQRKEKLISHTCAENHGKKWNTDIEEETKEVLISSKLRQWPVQIKLAPVKAPYFENADLLIAADCTAYAYGNFHNEFMNNKITLIGCPKLDNIDYAEKLAEIICNHHIQTITVIRMEVPCCRGIQNAVKNALEASQKQVPCKVITISTDGRILE